MAATAGGEEGAGLRRAERSPHKERAKSRRLLTCLAAPSAAAAGRGLQSKPLRSKRSLRPQRPPDPEPALPQLPSTPPPPTPSALRSHFRRHLGYRRADSPRHCGALARRPGAAQLSWRPPALPPPSSPSSSSSPSSPCGAGPGSPAWLASPRRGRVPGPGRARWQRRRRQLRRLPPSRP